MAAKVTGYVGDLKASVLPGSKLRWKYLSSPAHVQGRLIASGINVVTNSDPVTGRFEQVLTAGDYELTIDGHPDKWSPVGIPDDNNEYAIGTLLISDPPPAGSIANATATVYGLIRLTNAGFGIPEQATTFTQAKAIVSERLKIAGWIIIFGGAAVADGNGGVWRFKLGGTEAESSPYVLRPDDYATAGANQGTLIKLLDRNQPLVLATITEMKALPAPSSSEYRLAIVMSDDAEQLAHFEFDATITEDNLANGEYVLTAGGGGFRRKGL